MNKKGMLALEILVVGLVWGTSFVATTAVLKEINIGQYLALRWGIATITGFIFVVFKLVKLNYKGKNLKPLIILMLLQPCVYATLETIGLDMTTASEASIILAILPITIAIITAIGLKERLNKNVAIAAVICLVGVIFTVVFEKDFEMGGKLIGYGVLYLCVLCGAAYTITGNKICSQFSPIEMTIAISIGGGLFFAFTSLLKGELINGVVIAMSDWKTLILLIYLGVFCSVVCFFLYNDINSKLIPAKTSLFVENSVTLVGVISAVIINNDSLSIFKIIGVILLILGIVYLSVTEEKENQGVKE